MKRLLKKATVTVITAAILGSIIPMKSDAEEIAKPENTINQVNTQTSWPAPPIIQLNEKTLNTNLNEVEAPPVKPNEIVGRSGIGWTKYNPNFSLPKAQIPTIKTTSNFDGTDTGYLDISWEPVENALGYKLAIYTGQWYEYVNVGNVTSFSSKGMKWFPTEDELGQGIFKFHWDKTGRDFPNDPQIIYQKAKELGVGYNEYSHFNHYWVRLIAVYPDGDSPVSDANTVTFIKGVNEKFPQMSMPTVQAFSNEDGTGTGYLDVLGSQLMVSQNIK